jgi:hypothetical protein
MVRREGWHKVAPPPGIPKGQKNRMLSIAGTLGGEETIIGISSGGNFLKLDVFSMLKLSSAWNFLDVGTFFS